ncbi:hypothetical protein DICPUDRAFT_97798 [Dictyostelium purpureum]|uniref:beta-mannosidase n=1 Tax=Dictyostelium purpureum TaxID=5786 RepID=F0ZJW6_DICPU|nr:uncharacterized protein DICPUDRAFT_97798 [Dictyostelium purpureum]EGC35754.1 hypothetical protein DICPUDRAFT_97798 [Dictyostelium purpureum]|eukprot:XP_003287706.1 hypothetical protein DICPUDRAFT_97798 [Dictyostelium purpureum]
MNYFKKLLNGDWNLQLVNFKSGTIDIKKGPIPISQLTNQQSIRAVVPGEVHMDLYKVNGLVPDFYIGENELKYRWIAESDWKYSREFIFEKNELEGFDHADLICEGIDTVADIFINGTKLPKRTENMFRMYRFTDIKKLLYFSNQTVSNDNSDSSSSDSNNDGNSDSSTENESIDNKNNNNKEIKFNKIEIIIYSPEKYCKDLSKEYKYTIPEWEYPNGIHHRNFIRKCACHFGWDWGPCFCPMGIFKDIYIQFYSIPLFKYVQIGQTHKDYQLNKSIDLDFKLKFYMDTISTFVDKDLPIDINITCRQDLSVDIHHRVIVNTSQLSITNSFQFKVNIKDAKLWWPLGHGDQNLYDVTISVKKDDAGDSYYSVKKIIGLRTTKIDTSKDLYGRKFQFVVNGISVFAKGADWIPADHFLTRISNETYHHLLFSAKHSNMNCLRVWGGGIYESDYFYELCDQFGIMLWQDFMFGCALYPTNKEFISNVRKEVKYQVGRIGDHPSIILWCGSNESEQAIHEKLWEPIKENPVRYAIDFNHLYLETIMETLKKQNPDAFYWVSSPSNGVGDWGDTNDHTRGDTHYWAVWHSDMPFTQYLKSKSRFLSEFGFQSLPSFRELQRVLSGPDQLNITSPELEGRQRSPKPGNIGILKHVGLQFRVPLEFRKFVYCTQILQAISIKTGCEHWRRMKPYCMGTLYWQLNDIWVGPSWSSIEYNGNWKPLQYFARRFYQPILLSFVENIEEPELIEIWLTHDYEHLENIYLQSMLIIQVWDLTTSTIVNTIETIVSVVLSDRNQFSKRVLSTSRKELFELLPKPANHYIVTAKLDCSISSMKSSNTKLISLFLEDNDSDISNIFYPVPFKKLELKPTIIFIVGQNENTSNRAIGIDANHEKKCFDFKIESKDSIALFVWIECENIPNGHYNDNGFILFKHNQKSISFYPKEFDGNIVPKFNFIHLRDTY